MNDQLSPLGNRISEKWKGAVYWVMTIALSMFVAGCIRGINDLVPDQSKVGVSVSAVGHYGKMMGISDYSVDGFYGGNSSGWGGGGKTSCCVLLPRVITKPVVVTVQWESCDIGHIRYVNDRRVDNDARCKVEEHEAKVPIHFEVEPGESSGLTVHFLPGHKVEIWVARGYPEGSHYPGPKYPTGPAPDYAPLPSEKP